METKQEVRQPEGTLILRTLAMPSDTNANGDIFGGWIMSQMDMGGAILAKELARGRVVTVSVDSMSFIRPVAVGDVVCCYGKCVKVGRTSMQVKVEVWIKKVADGGRDRYCVTEALFTFVAIDKNGKPRPIPREDNPELDDVLSKLETQ
ncbi:acyl-CoA thioester hydrolase YciA [Ursidibacter maritimus]|uniref:Acyl-CoA thioester hydrolase YciA n=1 Tax=Ursidibacter maritimus TaxID=1331689 RepID=A0A949T3C0_9PAST|nr:acyl-CoA thioester hydrolase YciA [Ursidibacter maritimus]KAE9541401.1 acyl-CoA thioesterase [Ursidibacter maritimus]MBV6523832.1 acyl-CoA thioester hydrolase YciA [Ursidibacter maritimus]MBV6526107.1 acyl-CoA thioester hydrolase YciA [Ursidibacter maritimus]MBV6527147.1 acyl-CoA thioester hydrolase YciA [Ursidibacter maritimus]MBV6529018.1 acyl-CoA thioester hydrolase YciA [Ursidibacter maritimus]